MGIRDLLRASVTVQIARAIFMEAASRGHSLPELCARFEVSSDVLADVDARLPADVIARMWDEVPALCNDPHFGLHLAEKVEPGAATVIGYIFQSSDTVREGITRAVRFHRLLQDVKDTQIEPVSGGLRVTHGAVDDATRVPRAALEFGMAMSMVLAQRSTGRSIHARDVAFECEAPSNVSEHVRVFGVRPRYGERVNHIILDDAVLDLPLRTADSGLRAVLEKHAADTLAKLPVDNGGYVARVRSILFDELRGGEPTLEHAAKKMRITSRTLQRYLRDEGETFQGVLDGLRRDLAERYLRDPNVALDEVAFLLGFNDASAFHRAFVRWTGDPPGRFRRARAGA